MLTSNEQLLDVLNIPAPRILTWSTNSNNPIGAEYIIEERAAGERLDKLWYRWPLNSKFGVVSEIVKIEQQLASTAFTSLGSIYFKADVPTGDILSKLPAQSSNTERYRMGPLVTDNLSYWSSNASNLDRGPCKSLQL